MLRQMFVGSVMAVVALVGSASAGHAGVSVDLGIHLGSPPQFVQVPETPVSYAPAVGANLFLYAGQFFAFRGGVWFAGPGYEGPWSEVRPEYVPRPILAVPVQYYRVPPREWSHWRRETAPRWGSTWGRRWEERRPEHPAVYRDDHRGEHHTAYRDDHRGDRPPSHRDDFRDERHGDRVRAYRDEHRNGRYDDRR
ncbi:MAG: hypothetical protein Q7W02_13680 [Candidatus Rokubacteria bacterium]|nr:hypothetical protein [Candidatus Rokubacteria bacterium]